MQWRGRKLMKQKEKGREKGDRNTRKVVLLLIQWDAAEKYNEEEMEEWENDTMRIRTAYS